MGTRFDFLEANTNYSVRVCAVTRSQECGAWRAATCTMAVQPPPGLARAFTWSSEKLGPERNIFKLLVLATSQRVNHTITEKAPGNHTPTDSMGYTIEANHGDRMGTPGVTPR